MKMQSSPELNELAAALAGFQADMGAVPKLHDAKIPTKSGGEFTYSYADLADIIDAAKPHKQKHGLAVFQGVGYFVRETDGAIIHTITTRVMHTSGQWIESEMVIPHLGDIRALGSSITYGRRYSECAALGIVSDMDDDGQLAVDAYGENSSRVRTQSAPPSSTSTKGAKRDAAESGEVGPERAGWAAGNSNGNGAVGMKAKDRNTLIRWLANLDPPVRGDGPVLAKLRALLNDDSLEAVAKLTEEQGAKLFETLGIPS
jgi:hypothetical protein